MPTIPADKFRADCLKLLDAVARTRNAVVITKHGKPIARLLPYSAPNRDRSLAGSVLHESGSPYNTGDEWHAASDRRTDGQPHG